MFSLVTMRSFTFSIAIRTKKNKFILVGQVLIKTLTPGRKERGLVGASNREEHQNWPEKTARKHLYSSPENSGRRDKRKST